jgi:hypothetical protein
MSRACSRASPHRAPSRLRDEHSSERLVDGQIRRKHTPVTPRQRLTGEPRAKAIQPVPVASSIAGNDDRASRRATPLLRGIAVGGADVAQRAVQTRCEPERRGPRVRARYPGRRSPATLLDRDRS